MYTKIIVILVVTVTTVLSQIHKQGAQVSTGHGHEHVGYEFEYGVKDPHTHDVHSQKEHRDGKNVVGEYTLKDADGTERVVKYKAGPHIGYEAVVERKGHAVHPDHTGKGPGGESYVGVTHWNNQGPEEYEHEH